MPICVDFYVCTKRNNWYLWGIIYLQENIPPKVLKDIREIQVSRKGQERFSLVGNRFNRVFDFIFTWGYILVLRLGNPTNVWLSIFVMAFLCWHWLASRTGSRMEENATSFLNDWSTGKRTFTWSRYLFMFIIWW